MKKSRNSSGAPESEQAYREDRPGNALSTTHDLIVAPI
jgi:hypothetical protein